MYGMEILIIILGLITGSVLTIGIYKLPKAESWLPLPSCEKCGASRTHLQWLPLFGSYFNRGRCTSCQAKLPKRKILVEVITAVFFTLLYLKYGISIDFFASLYLLALLIMVFFIDIDHRIIPDELVIAGLIGGGLLFTYNLFQPVKIFADRAWWNPLIGILVGSGFLFAVALIGIAIYKSDEAMGMGDVKIFAPIGMFLGWRMTLVALLLSVFMSGIVGIFLIVVRKQGRKSTIPFGPFIVAGTFIAILYGKELLLWYLR